MSVTLTDLQSLDDLRNDPDEYARFLMEKKKKQREDLEEVWSAHGHIRLDISSH